MSEINKQFFKAFQHAHMTACNSIYESLEDLPGTGKINILASVLLTAVPPTLFEEVLPVFNATFENLLFIMQVEEEKLKEAEAEGKPEPCSGALQ